MRYHLLLGEFRDDGQLLLHKVNLLSLADGSSLLNEDLVEGSIEIIDSTEEVEESNSMLAENVLVGEQSDQVNLSNPSKANIQCPSRQRCIGDE